MQWLRHGKVTDAAAEALRARAHTVHEIAELELAADAPAGEILQASRARQWDIITTDRALADAAFEPRARFERCIVYLELEGGEVEQDDAIDRLFARYKRLSPKRLYTVTEKRVKIRQMR
jgi:hypothetical protein